MRFYSFLDQAITALMRNGLVGLFKFLSPYKKIYDRDRNNESSWVRFVWTQDQENPYSWYWMRKLEENDV